MSTPDERRVCAEWMRRVVDGDSGVVVVVAVVVGAMVVVGVAGVAGAMVVVGVVAAVAVVADGVVDGNGATTITTIRPVFLSFCVNTCHRPVFAVTSS